MQIKELVEKCESPLVQNTADEYNQIKAEMMPNSSQSSAVSRDATQDGMANGGIKTGQDWKWSGTDFVKSPTSEPWVNLNAILDNSVSKNILFILSVVGPLQRIPVLSSILYTVSRMFRVAA